MSVLWRRAQHEASIHTEFRKTYKPQLAVVEKIAAVFTVVGNKCKPPPDFDVSLCHDLFDWIHPGERSKWNTDRWPLFPHTHTHTLNCNPNSCRFQTQCFLFSDLGSWETTHTPPCFHQRAADLLHERRHVYCVCQRWRGKCVCVCVYVKFINWYACGGSACERKMMLVNSMLVRGSVCIQCVC